MSSGRQPLAVTGPDRKPRRSGFTLHGRPAYRWLSAAMLLKVTWDVSVRRMFGRPTVPSWSWDIECASLFLREQMLKAFAMGDPTQAREMLDALRFNPVQEFHTQVLPADGASPGTWFVPDDRVEGRTMLYLHGGGYAFHSDAHAAMVTLVAEAVRARTFALDYRLTPEHPHPAQLEDALAAHRWLLDRGADPRRVIVAGDSAGGHLALMLLQALREAGLPQPAVALCLCPWTDIGERGRSFFGNDRYDWVQGAQALQFGEWYRGNTGLTREELSPIHGDFRGVAPIYLQAGEKEILVDMIREFAGVVRQQGAEVTLEEWKDMVHDFQAFGPMLPESVQALRRLGEVADRYASRSD